MMRLPLLLFCIALAPLASAQITITQADMPSAGDTLTYHTTAADQLDVELTGADVTWDFSMLTSTAEGADIAVPVSATPILYQFYFNNPILYPQHDADLAMEGTDFDFQVLTIENVYEYFKVDADGYRNVGFGAMVNDLPTSVRRIPVDRIYQLPLQFGATDSSFSTWEVEVPNMFHFSQEQWRHNTVDGWGTIYLPADTFEVLRVRSVLTRHDSIFVSQFGQGFALDEPETVEYKWLANGVERPVLTIITVGGIPTTAQFIQTGEVVTGIATAGEEGSRSIYPNPASDELYVRSELPNEGPLLIQDLQGRRVMEHPIGNREQFQRIPVHHLPNGIYTIGHEGDRRWHQRFVIAR